MAVKVFYSGEQFKEQHEIKQFEEVYSIIRGKYEKSDEPIYILFNFYASEKQIDILLLTKNGIAIIELKAYRGVIKGSKNGNWSVIDENKKEKKFDNLFLQLKDQKFDLLKCLNEIREENFKRINKEDLGKIQCWGYFERGSACNVEQQLGRDVRLWFDIITADNLIDKIKFIKAGYFFKSEDMDLIVEGLNLRKYQTESDSPILIIPKPPDNSSSISEKVQQLLNKFKSNVMMLDALYQWATNPTTKSAIKYISNGNDPHSLIEKNIEARYGVLANDARKIYKRLKEEIGSVGFDFLTEFLEARNEIKNYFECYYHFFKDEVIQRVKSATEREKNTVWLYCKFITFREQYQYSHAIEEFLHLLKAVFDIKNTNFKEVTSILIKLGFINELIRVGSKKGEKYFDCEFPEYLKPIVDEIDTYIPMSDLIKEKNIEKSIRDGKTEEWRPIDELRKKQKIEKIIRTEEDVLMKPKQEESHIEKPSVPAKPDESTPAPRPAQFEITFPPYSDGKSLVFGRGQLKNKIAWGFEASKPLSIETFVTSDLHDINQPHVGSFQQIRTGKSTLASCVVLQVAFQGIPVVVFDPKPDYVSGLIPIIKTIDTYPDYSEKIKMRFKDAMQDIKGFDFAKAVEFEQDGKKRRILYQIYSFDSDLKGLPNCRVLKLPLLVLPPFDDDDFEDQCNASATSLVNCLSLPKGKAFNTLLANVMKKFKRDNPDREFMLKKDIEQGLNLCLAEAEKEEKKEIKTLIKALQGYYTANSYLYASDEAGVVRMDSIIMNPEIEDGDRQTVTISVIDVSSLPQEKNNPVVINYVSQVCGQLYNFVKRKRSEKPVQLFIVFDEAQNYLPDPSDQYNYARVVINRGASLGIKAWLMAQSPQAVEKEARKQFTALILSKVNEASVRDEVSKYVQSDSWTDKLKQTDLGKVLVINSETGKEGGKLCIAFTTPQTVNLLSSKQIAKILKG